MTPFTAPGNASGRRFFSRRHYNYMYIPTIIIQGVKHIVGTELLAPAKLIFNIPGLRCHLPEKGIPHLNQTRLRCHLSEKGIPHLNQTRLRCHLSEKGIPHLNQTRLRCHLSEKGIPHLNQTRLRCHLSEKGIPHPGADPGLTVGGG